MLTNLTFLLYKIKTLKYLYSLVVLKLIFLIIPGSGIIYGFEINKLFQGHNIELIKKVTISIDLALKKYDGQKIWLIYSIDSFCSIRNVESVPVVSNQETIILDQLLPGKLRYGETGEQMAIILDYSLESGNPCLYNIYLHNMNQPIELENRPIFWLEEEILSNSIDWLRCQFHRARYPKLKQQIITAVGAHHAIPSVVDFLEQVVLGNHSIALKIVAIHWLGQHDSVQSIGLLTFLAVKQQNILLRKKAIFALSQINDKTAKNVVTALASRGKNMEVRQEAIFWLSQIADDDALNTMNKILDGNDALQIKVYTVFAISQFPYSKAAPALNRIARSNPDAQVRKKARFWLERTRDHRIMDFVRELSREDERRGSN